MSLVQPISNLTKNTDLQTKKELILNIIGKIDQIAEVSLELINYIANLLQNHVDKSENINKFDLLIEILKAFKPDLSDSKMDEIRKIITYMKSIKAIRKILVLAIAINCSRQIILRLLLVIPIIIKFASAI